MTFLKDKLPSQKAPHIPVVTKTYTKKPHPCKKHRLLVALYKNTYSFIYNESSPFSLVRILYDSSIVETKIFPSPISPVYACSNRQSTVFCRLISRTTIDKDSREIKSVFEDPRNISFFFRSFPTPNVSEYVKKSISMHVTLLLLHQIWIV